MVHRRWTTDLPWFDCYHPKQGFKFFHFISQTQICNRNDWMPPCCLTVLVSRWSFYTTKPIATNVSVDFIGGQRNNSISLVTRRHFHTYARWTSNVQGNNVKGFSSPGNYKTTLAAQWFAGTPMRWWHLNIFRNSARKRSCSHAYRKGLQQDELMAHRWHSSWISKK